MKIYYVHKIIYKINIAHKIYTILNIKYILHCNIYTVKINIQNNNEQFKVKNIYNVQKKSMINIYMKYVHFQLHKNI